MSNIPKDHTKVWDSWTPSTDEAKTAEHPLPATWQPIATCPKVDDQEFLFASDGIVEITRLGAA